MITINAPFWVGLLIGALGFWSAILIMQWLLKHRSNRSTIILVPGLLLASFLAIVIPGATVQAPAAEIGISVAVLPIAFACYIVVLGIRDVIASREAKK